jgi:methanogenic corrinoid protein MtbC1
MTIGDIASIELMYQAYLEALLTGDRQLCHLLVEEMLRNNIGIRTLYVDIFQRSLYHAGDLWERNKLSVARGQMATSITESLLPLAYPLIFSAPHNGRKAIVTCTSNQYHHVGGRMVADILELNGWDCHFLGIKASMDDLLSLLGEQQPDLLCFSMSVYGDLPSLLEQLERVRNDFPSLPIIVGGQAFRWGGIDQVTAYQGVSYVGSVAELEQLVKDWRE